MQTKLNIEKVLNGFIEVKVDSNNFLIIRESLTRIGVCNKRSSISNSLLKNKKKLFQSCHILSYDGKYYIVHFKELFLLDGKESSLDDLDMKRRNQIAKLLQDWGLLEICHPEKFPTEEHFIKMVKIVASRDRSEWQFVPKYHLGTRRSFNSNRVKTDNWNNSEYWTNHD